MCRKLICLISLVFVPIVVLTSPADAAEPAPVGWWRLDGNADDSSGNNNHGTLFGNPQWVAGKIGGALQFDGTDVYIDCGNGPSLDITGEITIAAWIYPTGSGNSNFPRIVDKSSGTSSTGPGYKIYPRVAENYILTLSAGGTDRRSSSSIVLNTWNYLAFIITGTQWRLFLNGTWEEWNVTTLPSSVNNSLFIGRSSTTGRHFVGMMDEVRIYNRALTPEEIQQAMEGAPPGVASDPKPDDEAIDVPRDVTLSWAPGEFAPAVDGHIVYLSANLNDVNNSIGGVRQSAGSYSPPQRLDFETTYYWRVDEVNGPPDFTVYQGDVWSFTTEPVAYAIENVIATASSSSEGQGPENAVNDSGLTDDLHTAGTGTGTMWMSELNAPQPTWIRFDFDKVYALHEVWVWNSNTDSEAIIGYGARDVSIEYSVDGNDYTPLGTTHEFTQAPGEPDYAHDTTVDFGGVLAKSVRFTINTAWGTLLPMSGLSEVRFFHIPLRARDPYPDSGATDVDVDVTLGWRAGRQTASHNVYVSTDPDALTLVGPVAEPAFDTALLDLILGQTYHWQVDEVNEAETPTTWQGDPWSFTTQEYLVVDDFESYNDNDDLTDPESHRIFESWPDGYLTLTTNGALIGNEAPPYAEVVTVHGGSGQAMPMFYSNTGGPTFSEATRTFADPQDWTAHGVTTLGLWFHGTVGNTGQMYVKINGTRIPYDGEAGNIARLAWQPWTIDLTSSGLDLQSVGSLTIGVDGSGSGGTLYFDDIRVDRQAPPLPSEELWIEAEAATTIEAPMQIFDDPTASGGKYIMKDPLTDESTGEPPADGLVTYTFTVAGGTYKIACRVISNGVNDSFWVRIPGATTQTTNHSSGWVRWNDMTHEGAWGWHDIWSSDDGSATVEFTMPAGTYTLELRYREDLTQLDALVITSID